MVNSLTFLYLPMFKRPQGEFSGARVIFVPPDRSDPHRRLSDSRTLMVGAPIVSQQDMSASYDGMLADMEDSRRK